MGLHHRSMEYKDAIKALRKEMLMSQGGDDLGFQHRQIRDVPKAAREYADFFNEARPSFSLGCLLTPAQCKERRWEAKLPAIVGKSNGK